MDTRATRTRLNVLPIPIALLLNLSLVSPLAPIAPDAMALTGGSLESTGLNFVKTADAEAIDAGDEVSFTLAVWNDGPADALDVTLHDDLPAGLAWSFELVSGGGVDADCSAASSMTLGGEQQMSIDCEFGTLGVTSMEDGIVLRVFATSDRTDCRLLANEAWADASNDDRIDSGASIQVGCPPTLVIGQVARTPLEPQPLGGNASQAARLLPDTAMGAGLNAEPVTVAIELLAAFIIGSLGSAALAKARSRRR